VGYFAPNSHHHEGPGVHATKCGAGPCKATDNKELLIVRPQDESGEGMIMDKSDELKFVVGRNGDILFTTSQCDFCHFHNLLGCDPVLSFTQDVRVLKYI
jgi:hypothetical protein